MAKTDAERAPLPPYVPFKTFTGFIQRLKETTVPDRIDSSVLRSYAGSVGRALISTLKFLGLIAENGNTTDNLRALVTAYGTPEWGNVLSDQIFDAYRPIIGDLNLDTATARQLEERFKATGAEGVVLERCVTFFTQSMKSAGLSISPHITSRQPRRTERNRATKSKKARTSETNGDDALTDTPPPSGGSVKFSLPVPEKGTATIFIPAEVTSEDWEMIDVMMRAYISRLQKGKKE